MLSQDITGSLLTVT